MRAWRLATGLAVASALALGCNAATRYSVLAVFLDGVPPPQPKEEATAKLAGASASRPRHTGYREHGPYAAKLCNACHVTGSLSELVAPREQLCLRCHELKTDKKYVHGPLASGGCLACHDPHSSQYRYFLLSESDSFCFRCHEPQVVARVAAHTNVGEQCTRCHDPHMSDNKYLLR
jgi:predicted CXXCH cytochrome family protein